MGTIAMNAVFQVLRYVGGESKNIALLHNGCNRKTCLSCELGMTLGEMISYCLGEL